MLPELRGRRIGESLLGLCTQELRSRNFLGLSLTVTEANTKAVELYKRLGFETAGVLMRSCGKDKRTLIQPAEIPKWNSHEKQFA